MHSTLYVSRQRQIRGFVIGWLGITLLLGALTFVGIYYATGRVNLDTTASSSETAALIAAGGDEPQNAPALEPASVSEIVSEQAPMAAAVPMIEAPETAAAAINAAPVEAPAAEVPAEQAPLPETAARSAAASSGGAEPPTFLLQAGATATPVPSPTPVGTPTPAPAAPAVSQEPRFELGIQVQPNPDPAVNQIWMGEVRDKLRLNWIKKQVRWEDVEPVRGQYDWTELDVSLPMAQEYGLKVLLSIVTAPDWAREPGNRRLDEVGPPADPQDYANFVTTLLNRYPRQVHAIEVWNEMNIDREWASIYGLSANNYVTLLRTAYQAIKAVDPSIIVVSGALSPTGWNDGVQAYDDFVYMGMLIQAGMLNTTDCVGAHHNGYNIGPNVPYNAVPNDPTARFRGPFDNPHHSWSFYSTLQGYAQRIQQAGSDIPLCVTEFGWPTTEDLNGFPRGFEFANDNTLAEQARFIGEAIELMEDWGFVRLAFLWNLNYGPQAGWDATNDNVPYSLLRPEWQNAPAYDVIAAFDFAGR